MDPRNLIELANRILAAKAEDDVVELLGEYSVAFDAWYGKYQADLPSAKGSPWEAALKELKHKHEAVLSVAKKNQGEIKAQLRKLKKKGKGILAYTDRLPKRVTTTRPRKL